MFMFMAQCIIGQRYICACFCDIFPLFVIRNIKFILLVTKERLDVCDCFCWYVTDKVIGSRVQPSLFGEDQTPDPGDGGNRAY